MIPDSCDILVYGTMGGIASVAASSLESHGLKVAQVPFPQNIFRDEFGYCRGLQKAVAALHPAMVMPVGCLIAASRVKADLPAGVVLPVDSEDNIRLLDGKVSGSRLAATLGVPQPRIYASPDDMGQKQVVFKRNVSFGGHGVHLPWNRKSLDQLIAHQPKGEEYLIEDFVEGEDVSVDCVRLEGYFRASCYRSLKSKGNGPSVQREKADFPRIVEYARRMLDYVGYRGVCGFDFRVDTAGNPFFLECNPRFTGGLESQISWGFDIPFVLWEKCRNGF